MDYDFIAAVTLHEYRGFCGRRIGDLKSALGHVVCMLSGIEDLT